MEKAEMLLRINFLPQSTKTLCRRTLLKLKIKICVFTIYSDECFAFVR